MVAAWLPVYITFTVDGQSLTLFGTFNNHNDWVYSNPAQFLRHKIKSLQVFFGFQTLYKCESAKRRIPCQRSFPDTYLPLTNHRHGKVGYSWILYFLFDWADGSVSLLRTML